MAQAADLLIAYKPNGCPLIQLAIDSTFSNAPPPLAASTGANACATRSEPNRLTSRWRCADSMASASRKPPMAATPALLMTSVTSVARAAAAATSAGLDTSSLMASTPGKVIVDGSRAAA